jgi:hypothetical protein
MNRRRAIALASLGASQAGGWFQASAADDQPLHISVGEAAVDVTLAPVDFDLAPPAILRWISNAANAVRVYFGRFPVDRALVRVRAIANRSGVRRGTTYGGSQPRTLITLGQHATGRELDDDWTMTHEFVHFGFPSMERQHHWIEEGLATYVEPVARAQAGTLPVERVWGDMMRDMAQGQPGADDQGLDFTHTWGRTYWGGATFCLLADLRYRERTKNRRGLQHALRGILAAGGNIQAEWPIERAFKTGDDAVGVPVLTELYTEMKDRPAATDLDALWRRLGVEFAEGRVVFHDAAPLAGVRRGITMPVDSGPRTSAHPRP